MVYSGVPKEGALEAWGWGQTLAHQLPALTPVMGYGLNPQTPKLQTPKLGEMEMTWERTRYFIIHALTGRLLEGPFPNKFAAYRAVQKFNRWNIPTEVKRQ